MEKTLFVMPDHLSLFGTAPDARPHRHDFLHLIIAPDGLPGEWIISGETYNTSAVLINSRVPYQIISGNRPLWLILIDHTSPMAVCLRHLLLTDDFPQARSLSAQITGMLPDITAFTGLTSPGEKEYRHLWQKLTAALGVTGCYQPHEISDVRIRAVITALRSPSPLPLQDSDLLTDIYLSRSRLSHLFSDTTGGTLKGYILFQRLIRALSAIAQGDTATAAALDAGFDSPSHLSAVCRTLTGIQPRFARQVSRFLKVSP